MAARYGDERRWMTMLGIDERRKGVGGKSNNGAGRGGAGRDGELEAECGGQLEYVTPLSSPATY